MIRIGDKVKCSFFKERQKSRDLICTKVGKVMMVYLDQAWVKFDLQHKPEVVPLMNVEKVG